MIPKWLLFLICLAFPILGRTQSEYLGEWKLVSMIYQQKAMALPNPDLNLRFTFYSNGLERLYWDRGSSDFCESFATYQIRQGVLRSEVISVNPLNAVDCEMDPDMQLGTKTMTRIKRSFEELQLFFQLGDEDLIYVFHRWSDPR